MVVIVLIDPHPWSIRWNPNFVGRQLSAPQDPPSIRAHAPVGLSGARDEFHLAAIVRNLKTLAKHIWRPRPHVLPPQSRAWSSWPRGLHIAPVFIQHRFDCCAASSFRTISSSSSFTDAVMMITPRAGSTSICPAVLRSGRRVHRRPSPRPMSVPTCFAPRLRRSRVPSAAATPSLS